MCMCKCMCMVGGVTGVWICIPCALNYISILTGIIWFSTLEYTVFSRDSSLQVTAEPFLGSQ